MKLVAPSLVWNPARHPSRVPLGTLLMITSLLSGCETYRAAPQDPVVNARVLAQRQLDSAPVRQALAAVLPDAAREFPPQAWDRAQLLVAALAQNPQWQSARAQAALTDAQQINAAKPATPDLTLQSEYARREQHPWLYGIALNWPLLGLSQGDIARRQATAQSQMARLQLMQEAWQVRQSLVQALTEQELAVRSAQLLDRIGQAQDDLLDIQRRRIAAGEDPADDILPLQQERALLDQQRAEVRSRRQESQARLASALGIGSDALQSVSTQWTDWGEPPAIAAASLQQARERALLSRADLGVAMQEYAVAEAALQRAVAAQYPHLQISPGYYWDHGIAKLPLDVSFPLPWSRARGEIAEARAARELVARRMLAVQAGIRAGIDAAAAGEAVARDDLDAARRQSQAAQVAAERSRARARAGAAGRGEALSAELIRLRAEWQMLERRGRLQAARVELENALQTPLSGPEVALASDWARTAGRVQ